MILDDPDLLSLVLSQMGIELETVDVAHPQQLRSLLRLVCRSVCGHLDAIVTTYRDCRRSRDATLRVLPLDVSELATLALRRLGPLRCLQLEGLNDDALEMVLEVAADPKFGGRLENLSLQRGVFSGTCAFTYWEDAPTMLLPRLRELELGGCGFLTDAGLEALTAAAAPTLTRLRVTVNALLRRPRPRTWPRPRQGSVRWDLGSWSEGFVWRGCHVSRVRARSIGSLRPSMPRVEEC
jgi:hypothetical protein